MFDTESIRQRNPILETVEREAGVKFKKVGTWHMALCPLHKNTDTPSFGVKDDTYHCFGNCDPERNHGDVIKFIMVLKQMTFVEACQYLGGESNAMPGDIAQLNAARKVEEQKRHEAEMKELAEKRAEFAASNLWKQYHDALTLQARVWWKQQGVGSEDWQNYWQLGVVDDLWQHGRAYSIPYFSASGQPVTMQYRFETPNGLGKYRAEPDLGSYGFIARHDLKFDKILICEGAKKAMVTHVRGTNAQMQVIGFWSENNLGGPEIEDLLNKAKTIWWWPDPQQSAYDWVLKHIARLGIESKSRIVRNHLKPDDALLQGMTTQQFSNVLKSARKVK